MQEKEVRIEKDSMGEMEVPRDAYYGAQTQRAVENFQVSPYRLPAAMRDALAMLKAAAAAANSSMGLIAPEIAEAIISASEEVRRGRHNDQFPVDVFQTGSGTSWNMNMNEVLANRAQELLSTESRIHPNDQVNRGQSSNDVIPSALNIAARLEAETLIEALNALQKELENKARAYSGAVKLGRTHLQDAVPMTAGQEFGAWAGQIERSRLHFEKILPRLEELPLGGTAVGTGLNSSREFAEKAAAEIAARSGFAFHPSENPFVQISSRDEQLALMSGLNEIATVLMKIAQDIRLLSSGPRGGLGELSLPKLQPGSSIMPGKVNPVIPEMVIQAAAFIMGKQVSVTIAGQNAPLQLNIMQPLISHEILTSLELLRNVSKEFNEKCIRGLEVREEKAGQAVEQSLAMGTPLALRIGYDAAAALAARAYQEGKTIREIAIEEAVMSPEELDEVLDPKKMAGPF